MSVTGCSVTSTFNVLSRAGLDGKGDVVPDVEPAVTTNDGGTNTEYKFVCAGCGT